MDFILTRESVIFLVSLAMNALTILVVWQKQRAGGMRFLLLAMISIAIYNLFALLDASSAQLAGRILWSKLEYLGANSVAPLLVLFFINYPFKRIKITPLFLMTVFFIPVSTLIAVMTNESHYLFYTGFEPIAGTVNGYHFLHGPFYWIALLYNYLCGAAVIVLIFINSRRFSGLYRLQSLVMLAASGFPFVAGLMYATGANPIPGMDILPVGFSISGLGIVFSVVFLRMFELIPVSRNLLVENLQDGVVVLDNQMRVVDINPAAKCLLECEHVKVGMTIDSSGVCGGIFNRTDQPVEIHQKDASVSHLLSIPSLLMDENEKLAGYMFVLRNMTEIRQVEQALHQSQERYRSLIEDVVDAATIGICILDKDFRIVWVNQTCVDYWFFDRETVLKKDVREVLQNNLHARAENREDNLGKIFESYRRGTYLENLEIHFKVADGKPECWVLYSSKPIRVGYYTGGRIEQLVDITEQKRLQAKVELLAITDELTGIYNRRGLFELGTHDFNRAHRTRTLLSVIYLDIDHYKLLNDRYGHAKGDRILVEMVSRVKAQLRDMDIFARYGGDEFVILIPDADLREAEEVAERIRDAVKRSPFPIDLEQVTLTVSQGVAQIAEQDSFAGLLDRADRCMYRAKQKGRDKVEIEKKKKNN